MGYYKEFLIRRTKWYYRSRWRSAGTKNVYSTFTINCSFGNPFSRERNGAALSQPGPINALSFFCRRLLRDSDKVEVTRRGRTSVANTKLTLLPARAIAYAFLRPYISLHGDALFCRSHVLSYPTLTLFQCILCYAMNAQLALVGPSQVGSMLFIIKSLSHVLWNSLMRFREKKPTDRPTREDLIVTYSILLSPTPRRFN